MTQSLTPGELERGKRGSCLGPGGRWQRRLVTLRLSLLIPSCPKLAWDRKRASETKPNRPPNPPETDNESPASHSAEGPGALCFPECKQERKASKFEPLWDDKCLPDFCLPLAATRRDILPVQY